MRIGHNIIGFDEPALLKLYPDWFPEGKVRDTLILTRLMWADIKDSDFDNQRKGLFPAKYIGKHSLAAWGHRLGDYKDDYSGGWEAWSEEMQSYCEQDVHVTATLWKRIVARSEAWGLDILDFNPPPRRDCIQLEHDVAKIVERQTRHGFAFNISRAYDLVDVLQKRTAEIEADLAEAFPPITLETVFVPKVTRPDLGYEKGVAMTKTTVVPFNPSSRQQIGQRLRERGWKPETYTSSGQPEITEIILESVPIPEAALLAEYFVIEKRLGMLATGRNAWLKLERNGRIHGRVTTNGAVTGRMTHSTPNLAQVPSLENVKGPVPYGRECRELFMASAGKVLVGCDADALELRDLAGYMARYDNGDYVRVILQGRKEDGTDMHSVNARALGCDRTTAKTWFYAFLYGAGDHKLANILGCTVAEAKRKKSAFLAALPALGRIVKAIARKLKSQGYLTGLDGRQLHIRSEHAALNTLLQSAGAIQMKRALVILDTHLQGLLFEPGKDYEFVANVHDEWQIETHKDYAENIGAEAAWSIAEAGRYYDFGCPLKGNYAIGNNWAETH